jgi:hypothetical protein
VTEGSLPTTPAPSGPDGATADPVAPSGGSTVEEVEAIWRNRFSARDRAHNAEVESLTAQMNVLRQQPTPTPAGEPGGPTARERELEQQLATTRAAYELRGKYPDAAAVLGDEITKLAEEKIAAINAGFSPQQGSPTAGTPSGQPPIIDPNAAPRTPSGGQLGPKKAEDMEIDELHDELRKLTPAYQEMVSNR